MLPSSIKVKSKCFRSLKAESTLFFLTNFLLGYGEGEVCVHLFLSLSFQSPSKRDSCINREKNIKLFKNERYQNSKQSRRQ